MTDVLVIEDDETTRRLIQDVARDLGLRSHGVDDGQAALEWLQSDTDGPRLIVLNLYMPVMNGFEFRARQRADPRLAAIPTIIVTGNPAKDPDRVRAMNCPVLVKPFDPDELGTWMQKAMGASQPHEDESDFTQPPQ